MMDDEGINKPVVILAFVGVVIMGVGIYVSMLTDPIIGAGIIFAGASLLVLPMSKALL